MDVLSNFILTKCVEGPGISVLSTPLYKEYKQWAEDAGEFVLSQTRFSSRLQERGFTKKPTKRGKVWYGIGLRSDDPDPDGPKGDGFNPSPGDGFDPTLHPSESRIDKTNTATENLKVKGGEGKNPINTTNDPRVEGLYGKTLHHPSPVTNPSPLENLEDDAVVALDIESTGLNPWNGDLPTVLSVYGRGMAEPALFPGRDIEKALAQLEGRDVVAHNAIFDLPMLERYYPGTIRRLGRVYDTLTLSKMAYAGQNFERHGLADCLLRELGIKISKEQQKSNWSGPLSEEQIEYAKKDVLHLPQLLPRLLKKLEDQSKVVDLEVDLTPVLADMKVAGVKVNAEGWREVALGFRG
jgi:DNA polymerase III epsilon subunit-like protein